MLHGVALAVPWTAGVATLDADLSLLQPIGAVDGPYDGAVLGMVFSDSDGAALLGLDVDGSGSVDHLNLGSTDPAGIATFGIYNRETELIHQREIR
jgi:hypothetical protein